MPAAQYTKLVTSDGGIIYVADPVGNVVECKPVTASQDFTATADATGLSVTFNADPNRQYRVYTAGGNLEGITAVGTMTWVIDTGASGAGTQIAGWQVGTFTFPQLIAPLAALTSPIQTGLSGTVSYHVRGTASAGALRTNASATSPLVIGVDDVGPA
jgi:hypothetical protein